jgi:hypothetical protein
VYYRLLCIGYDLPKRGWGKSSFGDNIPVGAPFEPAVQPNCFPSETWLPSSAALQAIEKYLRVPSSRPRRQAFAYCVVHFAACSVALLLSLLLYNFFAVHTVFIILLLLIAVYNGANYYYYSFGKKLAKVLKKALEADPALPGISDPKSKGEIQQAFLTKEV